MLKMLMEGIKRMVKVYNENVKLDDKIKILVLPNTKDGKEAYDLAKELLKEKIE